MTEPVSKVEVRVVQLKHCSCGKAIMPTDTHRGYCTGCGNIVKAE